MEKVGNKLATVEYSQIMFGYRDIHTPPLPRKEAKVRFEFNYGAECNSLVLIIWNLHVGSMNCYLQKMLTMFSIDGEKVTRDEFDFACEMMYSFNRSELSVMDSLF